jgi:pectin methylesterase-like acyl-CoA thioesterase
MGKDCWQPQYRTISTPSTKKLLTVAADGSGDFTTIQAAVNAVPESGRSSWADGVTIHVKPGVYREVVCANLHKRFVTLRGDGAGSTTITAAQGSVQLMWPNGSTVPNPDGNWPSCGVVRVVPDDFRLEDIAVHNTGAAGRNHNVALQVLGERVSAVRTRLIGGGDAVGFLNVRQHNSYDPARGEYLIEDSYVEGAGPDIFCLLGNSTVRNTTIFNRSGGNCIYYAGFLTFDGCDFTSTKGMIFGNTGGNHVLRVEGGSRVRKGVLNLASIQRAYPGDSFDMIVNVTVVN